MIIHKPPNHNNVMLHHVVEIQINLIFLHLPLLHILCPRTNMQPFKNAKLCTERVENQVCLYICNQQIHFSRKIQFIELAKLVGTPCSTFKISQSTLHLINAHSIRYLPGLEPKHLLLHLESSSEAAQKTSSFTIVSKGDLSLC